MRRAVPCEAMLRPERRDARWRAMRRVRPSGPLSIVHCPFSIIPCSSHTAKLQHGGGEIKHLAKTMPRAPRFLLRRRCTALIVNRLAANGQNGLTG